MGEVLLGDRKQTNYRPLLKMIDKEVIICKEDFLHSEVERYT